MKQLAVDVQKKGIEMSVLSVCNAGWVAEKIAQDSGVLNLVNQLLTVIWIMSRNKTRCSRLLAQKEQNLPTADQPLEVLNRLAYLESLESPNRFGYH